MSNPWLGGAGEHVGVIDENRFHNCVREWEKALLVPVWTKRIAAGHENWIEQHS